MNEENLINIDDIEEIPEEMFDENDTSQENKENYIEKDKKDKKEKSVKKTEKLAPTDDIITDNLVESFALLSSMLDEAKSTKENIEKIHESILKLLEVVTELRDVSEEFSKVNQIVKEINVLVKAISVNNSNIKDLIDVIYKITEKQKKLEQDVNAIKNEIFFTDEETISKNKGFKNGNNFLLILNLAISGGILILLFLLKAKGGI